ncbi:MAG: ATP-binding protein, partial [Ferrovibrio sp.]
SIVVGQAQMLKDSAADTPFAERADKIETAAARCARIARTFLAMARQRKPARRPVQLERIVEDVLGLLDYNLRSSGVIVERLFAAALPAVHADPDQINQVLSNLIVNAQQALASRPAPRRVLIEIAVADKQWIELRVSDNGPGIPSHLRRRVFEPFFTTKPAGQGPGSGTGIGLAVSHGIATAHGGTLDAGETADGGACFTLRLPLDATAAQPATTRASAVAPALVPGLTALVVDDEDGVADLLAEILTASGFDVTLAEDGQTALNRLHSESFSVILTDLRMPGLDGPSLFARLRSEKPRLTERIIFVTGDTLSPDVADFLRDSGRPCLEKPFAPDDVRRTVAAVLAGG